MVPLSDSSDDGVPDGWDFWHVKASGDKEADYATGREYAELALANVADSVETQHATAGREFDISRILSRILFAIVSKSRLGPIECGFLDRVGQAASVAYYTNQHQFLFDVLGDDTK